MRIPSRYVLDNIERCRSVLKIEYQCSAKPYAHAASAICASSMSPAASTTAFHTGRAALCSDEQRNRATVQSCGTRVSFKHELAGICK